jgi:hypothetical protein
VKNLFQYIHERIFDPLIGKENVKSSGTDILIASGQTTPSSAGTFTLASFIVAPGYECIIGDVDFGAGASATATVTITYKNYLGTSVTITRYIYLGAAGFVNEEHDFDKRPFAAFYNPFIQNNPVTVTMQVLSAASGTQYTGNMAYVVRSASE